MFSHVTLGTNDWARARPFWQAVMAVLGQPILFEQELGIAYGEPTGPKIFIGPAFDRQPASNGNGTHVAFLAKNRATVDAFHAAALQHGGTDEGAPGLRPHYHPNYYGAYVRVCARSGWKQAAGRLPFQTWLTRAAFLVSARLALTAPSSSG